MAEKTLVAAGAFLKGARRLARRTFLRASSVAPAVPALASYGAERAAEALPIAFLGSRKRAGMYATALQSAGNARLVGISDTPRDVPREAKAVIVAVPLLQRGASAVATLRAGRHVLVEPPIAATYDEFDRMVGEANRADLRIGSIYPLHFSKACIQTREIVELGRLGRVTGARIASRMKHDPLRGYLGPALELLDAARWVLSGSPVTIAAPWDIEAAPAAYARALHLLVTLGATVVTCSTGNGPGPDTPGGWAIIFSAERGAIKLTGDGRLFLSHGGGAWTAEPHPSAGGLPPMTQLIVNFSSACQSGHEPEVNAIDGMAGIALMSGAVASARDGRIAQLVQPGYHRDLDREWVLKQRQKRAGDERR